MLVLSIPNILTTVFSFCTTQDTSKAREVCRLWADVLPRVTIHFIAYWKTDRAVKLSQIVHMLPPFIADIHKITVSLRTVDQGLRPRGQVYFSMRNSQSYTVAYHDPFYAVGKAWREDSATIGYDSAYCFMKYAIVGSRMLVCASGTYGGNMVIERLCVTVYYKPSKYLGALSGRVA